MKSKRQSVRWLCRGRGGGSSGCVWTGSAAVVSGAGAAELGLSTAAVSLLKLIREGGNLGRKDVMSCVSNPMEA